MAPSLLAADFGRLGEQVAAIENDVEMLHLDVMDGHFVPNLSFGIPVIASLRPASRLEFDCHLMTTNPDALLPALAEAGADSVSFHIEAATDPTSVIKSARDLGLRVGLAVSPDTPWEGIEPFAEQCDLLLIMSVHPGFGGQSFIPEVLSKCESARKWVEEHGLKADIQIDGGIKIDNVVRARNAGVNVFVAGTAIFGASNPGAAARELRSMIEAK